MSTILVNNVKPYTGNTVTVSGSTEVTGNIAVQGDVTLGNESVDTITIQGNTTASGNISASGDIYARAGTTTLGTTNLWGDVQLGSSTSHDIQFVGEVSSSIIPTNDNKHDLGEVGKEWRDIHIDGTAYIDAFSLAVEESTAATNGLFTLSGSQIFSSSAFPGSEGVGGSPAIFLDAGMSASLFVFKKA